MANHQSAKKRIRQTIKRRFRNRLVLTEFRTYLKRFRLSAGSAADSQALHAQLVQKLDKAWSKGVIHRNKAARLKSRLSAALRNQNGIS